MLDEVKAFLDSGNNSGRDLEEAAKRLKVSRSTMYQARKILKDAPGDLLEDVRQGRISIKAAHSRVDKKQALEIEQA